MPVLLEVIAGLHPSFCLRKYDGHNKEWESPHCTTVMLHQRYVQLWLLGRRKGVALVPESSVCVTMREIIYMLLASPVLLRSCVVQMPKREARLCYFLSLYVTASELRWICIISTQGTNKPWIKQIKILLLTGIQPFTCVSHPQALCPFLDCSGYTVLCHRATALNSEVGWLICW